MRTDQLYDEILAHPYWRHRIPLEGERYTPGTKGPGHWAALDLPERLDGMSVLDIGAFDGLHSFEAERRGAELVLATDVWGDPEYDEDWWSSLRPGKHGFNLVHDYLDSNVESKHIGVEDISPETVGTFDFVICSGVVYHLKEPYAAIENIVSVADERVVVESAVITDTDRSVMEFARSNDINWWFPTLQCLEEMVLCAGVSEVRGFHPDTRKSDSRVPDVRRNAKVEKGTPVYTSPSLTEKIDSVEESRRVQVLYETKKARRIQYGSRQGWISENRLRLLSEQSYLFQRAKRTLREEGPRSLLQKGLLYLGASSDRRRGVVHGIVG